MLFNKINKKVKIMSNIDKKNLDKPKPTSVSMSPTLETLVKNFAALNNYSFSAFVCEAIEEKIQKMSNKKKTNTFEEYEDYIRMPMDVYSQLTGYSPNALTQKANAGKLLVQTLNGKKHVYIHKEDPITNYLKIGKISFEHELLKKNIFEMTQMLMNFQKRINEIESSNLNTIPVTPDIDHLNLKKIK